MDRFNYNHLYYFYVIASEKSVTKASTRLSLAQPTLSAQLNQFELALGLKLFDRHNRSLILTEVGKRVFDYAQEIFKLAQELQDVVHDRQEDLKIKVQIGILDAIPKIISHKIVECGLKDPRASVHVVEWSIDELFEGLKRHDLDCIITNTRYVKDSQNKIFHHLLGEIPVYFVAHKKYAYLTQDFPKSLDNVPMILPGHESWVRSDVDHFFAEHEINPNILVEVADTELAKSLALAGTAPTILAKIQVEEELNREELVLLNDKPVAQENIWMLSSQRRMENPIAEHIRLNFKLGK